MIQDKVQVLGTVDMSVVVEMIDAAITRAFDDGTQTIDA